jgi:putative endonuclease
MRPGRSANVAVVSLVPSRRAASVIDDLLEFGERSVLSSILDISTPHASRYRSRVPDPRQAIGRDAEDAAVTYLTSTGVRVVDRNVRFHLGELDLVCRDRDVWVFVEVKCRRARWGDGPGEAVAWPKQRRLARLAQLYLKMRRLADVRCRFDVVTVTVQDDGTRNVRHLPGAFDAPV